MQNSDTPKVSSNQHYFLEGGGEMGALIRQKDWSNTPLGDPGTWPQSLRTMVSVMLDNPFGMYIAWGPEFIQLYNDGYRPILGTSKHPNALGISTRETFIEIWHIIGSMFEDVMKGKAVGFPDFMLPLNRNGFVEECYFDFSYSPIRKESGEVGGLLVTVIETTNKKKAEDNLKESKDQLQFAIEAAELATWDYNPITNKFTSNHRLKEWFGLEDEYEIDLQQAINSIAGKDHHLVTGQIQQSLQYASGGKLDIEFTVIHPATFQERILRAKGQAWFDDNKIGYRLNGILQDITEQAIARIKLEKSEEQLRIALEGGELGTFDFFPLEDKLLWSTKTKELFGLPPDADVNFDLYQQALHPDDRNTSQVIVQQKVIMEKGGLYELEYRTIGIADGRVRWLRSKGIASYDINNTPIRYTGVVQEITHRKEAEEALKESEERFHGMADNISQLVWMAEADGNIFWYNKKWYEYTGTTPDEMKDWGWQSVHDPERLPQVLLNFREAIEKVQPFEMIFPLKGADGKFRQFLTRMLPFMNREGKIDRWFGTNTDITERMEAEEVLKESEERFRALANDIDAFIFAGDTEVNVEFVNSKWLEFVGLKSEEGIGKAWATVTHPDDVAPMTVIYTDAVANQKSFEFEIRQRNPSGVYHWVLWKGVPRVTKEGTVGGIIGVGIDITDRKKSEQALINQQTETEKLQRLYEVVTGNTPDLVYILDLKYRFTYANPALLSMWGKTWEEAIGKNLLENGYEPWHAELHEREIDEIAFTKKPIRGTVTSPHAELGKRVYDYIFAPVLNNDGDVEAIAGTTRDITDIRKAEDELKRFKHMADNAMDPFILIRADGTFAYLNDIALELWGYSREEALQLHLFDIDMRYSDEIFKGFFAAEKIEKIPQFETLHKKKDGTIFPVEKNMGGLFLEGQPYLFAIARDITERKKNEQMLKESEARFRLLADFMPQHIWTADREGNLNYYNKSVYDYSGLASQQFDTGGWIQIVHPDDREENIIVWQNAISTGKDFHFEHRFQRHDGVYRWQLSRAVPQRDAAGNIQMWVGTSTDIQEIKEMDQQKDDFISIASHEIKTPLTTVKGYLELLQLLLNEENSTAYLYVSKANQAIERMHSLITELLDASKIQNGQLHYNLTRFDFNEMVDETIENIQHTSKKHRIQKTGTVNHSLTGDKERLQQVLINLLSNAIKYSPKTDIIFVNVDEQNGKIQVSVKDFGIGMAAQHLDKIFNRYYRVKEHAIHFQGLGIGLYLSSNIIRRHKGNMWVDSEPGKGSTFYFTIPIHSEQ